MSVTRIAEKAGVSIATVSRVLNNSRPVNPQIAEQVRRAMKELDLTPRQRRPRSRGPERHSTVAIVSVGQSYRGWFEMPVMAGVVAELSRAAQDHHMGILMTEMPDPQQLSPMLRRPEVDGAIIFMSSGVSADQIKTLRQHLPVVRVMGGQISPVQIDQVGVDNNAVGYLAAEYLLKRGIRNLAYLSHEPGWDFCKLRAQGFIAAAEEAGVTPTCYVDANRQTPVGMFGPKVVAEADYAALVQRLVSARTEPLGLFIPRDEETVHAYRLLAEAGVELGRDVVVISCDNEAVRLSTLHPRPASIDLVPSEIARHAIRRLASRIKHRDEPAVRILINPRLVETDEVAAWQSPAI